MSQLILNSIIAPNVNRANRAIGSMFFSVFGTAWLILWAMNVFPGNWILVAAIALLGLTLLAHSVRVHKNNKPAIADDSPEKKKRDRNFFMINSVYGLAILITVNVLINIGKPEWELMAIIFIVGLHFIPLARLFHYFPHYVLGLVLMVWAIAYACIAGPGNAIGCLGAGLILWCGAMYALTDRAAH